MMNLENVSKSFQNRILLDHVTVGISDTDKIGVIGVNGTGKSTLLRIAAGELSPDEGQVVRNGRLRISYLPQTPVFDNTKTILENVASAITGKTGHWDTEGEAKARLRDFGIDDPDGSPAVLSGGQRKRAALVAAILTPCDLLILDEPTNHLDHAMIEWLQDFLAAFRGAVLLVTHDRYFLDQVTNQILEIDRGSAYRYEGGYSRYLEEKQKRMDFAVAAERKAAALYRKDLAWMMRGARARSTKQKAHIRRFEELRDRDQIVEERQVQLNSLPSRLGGKTIILSGIGKSYDGRVLFRDFTYTFGKTDRIGIIGPNGCGKTTLLKTIVGQIPPDEGFVEIGQTVRIGYFSQENENLDPSERVIDSVRDIAEVIKTSEGPVTASAMCERFLFDGEVQYSLIEKLSGGEKRRLSLLRVLMGNPNVLILDEPTNDLDIQTLRILEDYLDGFAGIVITVSHDRYFLDRVVTRIFAFEKDGEIRRSEGAYEEYLARVRAGEAEKNETRVRTGGAAGTEDGLTAKERYALENRQSRRNRLSYRDQKEYDTIEEVIDTLERKSREITKEMEENADDYIKLGELQKEKAETDAKLEERMERYLELQDMVDSFSDS